MGKLAETKRMGRPPEAEGSVLDLPWGVYAPWQLETWLNDEENPIK